MRSIQLRSNVGDDCILKLQLPVDMRNQEIEIVMVIQAVSKNKETKYVPAQNGWPDNFFKDVVGSWEGDLDRPQQDHFECREKF
jgi:hypothetical protein